MRLYRTLILLLSPLLILVTVMQAIKYRDGRFLRERLGLYKKYHGKQPLWVHAASVGEVIAVAPFVRRLKQQFPNRPLLVSTCTPTGAAMVVKQFNGEVLHRYLPVDWRLASRRFVKSLRPRCGLIMETEIWGNLYGNCRQLGVSLITINGRLSHKTLNTKPWQKKILKQALQKLTHIYARSQKDADGFIQLGVEKEKVTVLGNLKFVVNLPEEIDSTPLINRPYLLAASTHDNEEQQLVESWLKSESDLLLVIAPRHPHRLNDILKQIEALTDKIAIRSRGEQINADTQIYLADTIGEMIPFMHHAKLVFMGGSLIPHGGHNILEPAALGKVILYGPSMHNFADESELFLNNGAAVQIENSDQLFEQCAQLLNDRASCDSLGTKAKALLNSQQQVLDHYLDAISKQCQLEHNHE